MAGLSFQKKLARAVLPVLCIGLLTTGCQTYQQKNKIIAPWRQGEINQAMVEAAKAADKNKDNKDAIIWRLEFATTLRAAGKYQESNKAFDIAQEKIDDYAEKAKVRLGQEAGALLSNQANLAYEGRSYDGIMLNTYKALNYLELGNIDRARPELIRAYQRQQDAVDTNQRRIQKAQDDVQKQKDSQAIESAQNDPKFQSQVTQSMAGLDEVKVYANYVNPFTVYLDGLYFMANATGESDFERARKSFERVASFAPNNEFVKQDLATAEAVANGKPLSPTTYVIFETGCAPERDQIRIDIPIIITSVSYVGAAFPTLRLQGNYQSTLTVSAGGASYNTERVASMDSVIATDFKNELPVVIAKTVAATVTKAAAAYALNRAANNQDALAGLFSQVATAAYQMAVNIADTRTWTTLPKEFQVCRFPTPADGKIELSTANGIKMPVTLLYGDATKTQLASNTAEATLNASSLINVVYVKSITAGTPLLVSQFKLK